MKRLWLILLLLTGMAKSFAQTDDMYRMEIGAGVGLSGYLGDFNGKLTQDLQPMGSILGRYIFNPYSDIKMNISYGKLKGTSKDNPTYYPDYTEKPYEFNNTLIDVALSYEYNFWPYGTGQDYRGAKRLTPFISGGLGMTIVSGSKSVCTANIPIGLGVKYKLGERTNIGLEWAMHFSLSDELDGVKDPYHIKSSGLFKNTDCYSTLQLTFTYSFMAKCKTCHNADE